MPLLEEWEKVLITDPAYLTSLHGKEIGCVYCHQGNDQSNDKDTSHVNLISDPSADSGKCNTCHMTQSKTNATSLHTNLNGLKSSLIARGGDLSDGSVLSTAFQNHCTDCHTSCGQCHISRSNKHEGGFIDSHNLLDTPSYEQTCYACHGARPGPEYVGANYVTVDGKRVYVPGDIHNTAKMTCTDCHSGTEMHGSSDLVNSRYDDPNAVSCLDCHKDIETSASLAKIPQHTRHLKNIECQVCHSAGAYKNCYSCHVGIDGEGLPYYQSTTEIAFEIGLNPDISETRPYKWVILRHAPIDKGSFAYYGDNLLPDFDSVSTWHYATPHNIQKNTPQNTSCNSCHGHQELFLLPGDIKAGEEAANAKVVVTRIPAKLPGLP